MPGAAGAPGNEPPRPEVLDEIEGAELGRDRLPWGGFGWGTPGLSQVGVPGASWLAGAVGASGLTFLCLVAAAWLADRVVSGHPSWGSLALVTGVLAVFVAVDAVRFGSPPAGKPFRVAVVQGNVPFPAPGDFGVMRAAVLDGHLELTQRLAGRTDLDLVVWGEDAIGAGAPPNAFRAAQTAAGSLGVPMIVGRSEADWDRDGFYNMSQHVDATGELVASYSKQHPVPFGEYVPLRFLRRYVTTLEQVPLDMLPGPEPVVFDVDGTLVATPICFESAFARDVRAFARKGAEVIVVSTNNSSFERSPASAQHLAAARMRAAEMRMWAVQAAISGPSAVISPDGRILQRTELFTQDILEAEVRARGAHSLYSRTGDLFSAGWAAGALAAAALYLAVMARGLRRRTQGTGSESAPVSPGRAVR